MQAGVCLRRMLLSLLLGPGVELLLFVGVCSAQAAVVTFAAVDPIVGGVRAAKSIAFFFLGRDKGAIVNVAQEVVVKGAETREVRGLTKQYVPASRIVRCR